MAPRNREQRLAKVQRQATELALALHLLASRDGLTLRELAETTGLPVGVVAGLVTAGQRWMP